MRNLKDIKITGKVIHGAKRGRELGFPTANIALNPLQEKTMPNIGIYAVWVHSPSFKLKGKLMGAASWGFNPTFGLPSPQLEIHILNFDADIYDEELTVEFSTFIRGEIKFSTIETLIKTIADDCKKTNQILTQEYQNA